jgi:8-oxo-dGTP pyrophosphatase MutT (NUDIX family)
MTVVIVRTRFHEVAGGVGGLGAGAGATENNGDVVVVGGVAGFEPKSPIYVKEGTFLRNSSFKAMEKRTASPQPHATMYCNNCGGKGHLFRTCKDPVLSCGILLVDSPELPVTSSDVNLLMIRRKDSMSFAEFMRGKYDPANTEYVSTLVKNMTLKEQALIATETFESLWRLLWGDDRTSQDYATSRERFNQLDRVTLMRSNLSVYIEPEWGFPKGRRMRGESDLDCALREFHEETNISREAYSVLNNIRLEETFTGLNGIRYRHVYFVALLKNSNLVDLKQKFTPMQRREISGIGWKSFAEAESLVRPHHVERMAMLRDLRSVLETFETEI